MSELTRKRLESQLIESISMLIMRGDIKDPGLSRFVSVTEAHLSADFSHARLLISSFENDVALEKSAAALNRAAGFIQSRIARILATRNTPKLDFQIDTSIRDGMHVNAVIDQLHDEEHQ